MADVIRKIKSFFLELQKKDDEIKRQWLIGLTSASMLIVLGLWIISMNSTIKKLGDSEDVKSETGLGTTFLQGFEITAGAMEKEMSGFYEKIQNLLKTTNSVTIQPTNMNFSNDIEPVTPKKFP